MRVFVFINTTTMNNGTVLTPEQEKEITKAASIAHAAKALAHSAHINDVEICDISLFVISLAKQELIALRKASNNTAP